MRRFKNSIRTNEWGCHVDDLQEDPAGDLVYLEDVQKDLQRLIGALRACIGYIEMDSERPHFLFAAKSLLLRVESYVEEDPLDDPAGEPPSS